MDQNRKIIYADDLMIAIRDDYNINSSAFAAVVRHINAAPAVQITPVIAAPAISEDTTAALERMGANAHGERVTEGGGAKTPEYRRKSPPPPPKPNK